MKKAVSFIRILEQYRILLLVVFCSSNFTIQAQYVAAEKVKKDFITLLQRTAVDPQPSFQIITTDSVITERGLF
jgi:hypothetical protein